MSIGELEGIIEGLRKNNSQESHKETLTGVEAIKQLQKMGGSF